MEHLASNELSELDGLNPSRALILQAYYAMRRLYDPTRIGVQQIANWIKVYEPEAVFPSDSLIQLTLRQAKVVHRGPGRPRADSPAPIPAPPFSTRRRLRLHGRALP